MILEELYKSLYEEYNKPRPGIHVSDITLCPRESCFRVLQPRELTNTDLNFFTSGRAIHEALQSLVRKYPKRFEIEKEVKMGDIVGHIDLFDLDNYVPIEAKSARVKTMDKPKAHYIRQLEAYMALTGADKGIILVQCLLNYEENPFVEFEHTMTYDERHKVLEQLRMDAKILQIGIAQQDPSLVRHINYDNELNWKCRFCTYKEPCERMRIEANAERFKENKK